MSKRVSYASQLLAQLPAVLHHQWVPIGSWGIRHRGTDTVVSGATRTPAPVSTTWLVVPPLDLRRFVHAWQSGADCSEWQQATAHARVAESKRRWVTFQGKELRYRKPGVRFGDPFSSP